MYNEYEPKRAQPWAFYLSVGIFIVALLMMLLSGCKSTLPILSHTIERHDTTIILPGASVHDTVPSLRTIERYHTIERVDSSGRAKLQWYIDAYGRLAAKCEAVPDTVVLKGAITKEKTVEVQTEERTPWWNWLVYGVLGTIILALGGYTAVSRFTSIKLF